MSQRAPSKSFTVLFSVTRPITVPKRILLLVFVHDPDDHPPHRTSFVVHCLASRHAIGGNDHALVHRRPMRINCHLRNPFGSAGPIDRLADDQPPSLKARMLAGSSEITFHAG